jgi:hypothetical protein
MDKHCTLHLWQSCACGGVGNIPNLQQGPARPRTSWSLLFWCLCWQGPEPGTANPRHWQAPAAWGVGCRVWAHARCSRVLACRPRRFIIHYPVLKLTGNGTKAGDGLRRRQPCRRKFPYRGFQGNRPACGGYVEGRGTMAGPGNNPVQVFAT